MTIIGTFSFCNMNKFALTILLIACQTLTYGVSVTYMTTFRLIEGGQEMTCENTLHTNDGASCFYCYNEYRQNFISDSLAICGASPYTAIELWKREDLIGHTSLFVFKNGPANGRITVIDKVVDYYSYEEPMPEYDWTLFDEDTIILGRKAYKATTEYRGRKWTAYYTPSIAISDGPWKLCGLPGLILYAKDSEEDFSFTATAIDESTPPTDLLKHMGKAPIAISAYKMAQLKKLFYWDENVFYQETWGIGSKRYDEQGYAMPPSHERACLIEFPYNLSP